MTRRDIDRIDILPGSHIVRRGGKWRAEIFIGAGQWRTSAPARAEASTPHTAAQRAIAAGRLAILHAHATGGGQAALKPITPPGVSGPLFAEQADGRRSSFK